MIFRFHGLRKGNPPDSSVQFLHESGLFRRAFAVSRSRGSRGRLCERKAPRASWSSRVYNLRCDIVHGRKFQPSVEATDLWNAHELARKAAVWMLHYLAHLARNQPSE